MNEFDLKYYKIIDYDFYIRTPLTERPNFLEKKGIYTKTHNIEENQFFFHRTNKNLNLYFGLNGYDNEYIYRVKENIISTHYNYLEQEIKGYEDYALNDFEFQLGLFSSIEDKLDFLNTMKKASIDCINSKWTFQFYCGKKNSQYKKWEDYIIREDDFSSSLFKIFCGFITLPLSYEMMREWKKIAVAKLELTLCEKEIEKLSTPNNHQENNTSTNNKKSKTSILEYNKASKYPLVFVSLEKELFFKEYLKTFNCIDKDNLPVTGLFKPFCDAFYKAVRELDDNNINTPKIIQRGRNKKKFIEMINKEYLFDKPVTKLSSGLNYTNIATDFIIKSFKNQKE